MTLLQLLQKAEGLAAECFMSALWLQRQKLRIQEGEKKLALTQTYVEFYEDEVASIVLDGTPVPMDRKVRSQRLLVMARGEARLYGEAVGHLVEELEMECIRAEQKKAMQAREEARA